MIDNKVENYLTIPSINIQLTTWYMNDGPPALDPPVNHLTEAKRLATPITTS